MQLIEGKRPNMLERGDVFVIACSYHRNGVCGNGFHVVRFDWRDDEGDYRRMIATLFEDAGNVAVLDVDLAAKDDIEFGHGNSWRGDHFESVLRLAVQRWSYQRDVKTLGKKGADKVNAAIIKPLRDAWAAQVGWLHAGHARSPGMAKLAKK